MLIGIWMLNSVYIMHIKLMDMNIKNFITAKSLDFGIFETILIFSIILLLYIRILSELNFRNLQVV